MVEYLCEHWNADTELSRSLRAVHIVYQIERTESLKKILARVTLYAAQMRIVFAVQDTRCNQRVFKK